uniref:Nudix hydrolase domain-containing protein n=1 Tax=Dunaliella tertiolecta TaxID=3047 RepID=A0A7S3RAE2_DUNTE|mmetsp:Transcript_12817/g.34962  ORF Transcript_12817/g.34962 Transcript_12817/m.34962 type:complete len:213 (-) Transcript_12817:994-1632(-)
MIARRVYTTLFQPLLSAPIAPTPTTLRMSTTTRSKKGAYTYEYPRPGLTVDAIIIKRPTAANGATKQSHAELLLINRKNEPFKNKWAIPGGFVDENESLDAAASRELLEETSVPPSKAYMTQIGMFGDPGRDPRGWVVSAAYAAIVPDTIPVKAGDDAQDAQWYALNNLPPLAFDHKLIIKTACRRLAETPQVSSDPELRRQLTEAAERLEG